MGSNSMTRTLPSFVLVFLLASGVESATSKVRTEVVVDSAKPLPGRNGFVFPSSFPGPVLNDGGQIVFNGFVTGADNQSDNGSGIFFAELSRPLLSIVKEDMPILDGNYTVLRYQSPALNNAGQVAFKSTVGDANGGFKRGFFKGGESRDVTQIAIEEQLVLGGSATISGLFGRSPIVAYNELGQVVAESSLVQVNDGKMHRGLILSNGGDVPERIIQEGQAVPDGNGSFLRFEDLSLNNIRQVSFRGIVDNTNNGSEDNQGIFRIDADNVPVQIVRGGQAAPDGNGKIFSVVDPAMNNAGQVVFRGSLIRADDSTDVVEGIFRGDGVGGLVTIAQGRQPVPDGNGVYSSFDYGIVLNDRGQAAFKSTIKGSIGGRSDNIALFRGDGVTEATQIARIGQAAPETDSLFTDFNHLALNELGQVAFVGSLFSPSPELFGEYNGLFLYDERFGVVPIALEGDTFAGSTITELLFADGGPVNSGLNANGQVAYEYELADGRRGIAIASVISVPEPLSIMLLSIGGALERFPKRYIHRAG